jgi:hypothetical protein
MQFVGASGSVHLDERLDRAAGFELLQYSNKSWAAADLLPDGLQLVSGAVRVERTDGLRLDPGVPIGEWQPSRRSPLQLVVGAAVDSDLVERPCSQQAGAGAAEEEADRWYIWVVALVVLCVILSAMGAVVHYWMQLKKQDSITAFISHSKRDGGHLAGELKHKFDKALLGVCTIRGRNFLDVSTEGFGGNARIDAKTIVSAVKRTKCFVLILTKTVLERPWCLVEIYAAISAGVPIVPVILIKQQKEEEYQFGDTIPHLEVLADNEHVKAEWDKYGMNRPNAIQVKRRPRPLVAVYDSIPCWLLKVHPDLDQDREQGRAGGDAARGGIGDSQDPRRRAADPESHQYEADGTPRRGPFVILPPPLSFMRRLVEEGARRS